MEIKDIVEGLNQYYETFPNRKEGHFVLQKTVDHNSNIKSLKTYKAIIWFVSRELKEIVCTATVTQRVTSEVEEKKISPLLSTSLTLSLLEYVNNLSFRRLCDVSNE